MYTRCPSCSSTFRVTAAVLQMAEGEVRCGSCSAVFNALHTLVDDWSGADFALPDTPQLSHPDAPASDKSPAPAAAGDAALEFNVPEQEWSRIFIEPTTDSTAADAADSQQQDAARSLEEETSDTDTWQAFLQEGEPEDGENSEPPYVIGEEDPGGGHPEILIRRGLRPDVAAEVYREMEFEQPSAAALEIAAESDDDMAEPDAGLTDTADDRANAGVATPETILDWGPPPAFGTTGQQATGRTWPWLGGSIAALLALTAQILHYNRDALAADPAYGAFVQDVYRRIGWPLYPDWPLDAYDIRGAKAIAENSAPGDLDIVAEIAVIGQQPVGLPVVRVVLRDRWSNPVATGAFDSAHYLAEPSAVRRLYAPGTLIPVQISLKDPGSAAQGYELDVCLPNRHSGLQCKAARDPFRP